MNLAAFGAALILNATAVVAEEEMPVTLDVSYLSEPTDWCPKDAGIPVVLKLTGLTVYGATEDFEKPPTTVVRRGNEIKREVNSPIPSGTIRNRRGVNAIDIDSGSAAASSKRVATENHIYGTLELTTTICDLYWINEMEDEVEWTLTGEEGKPLGTGLGKPDINLWFLLRGRSKQYDYITVGETRFLINRPLEISRKLETFVSPNKEQTQ